MDTFWQDLRYSLRTLLKKPGFALVVVTTLALGIGANATIFTWIKAVLLASLPGIEQPEKLVEIWGATRNNSALSSSYVDYLDYRDQNKVAVVQVIDIGRREGRVVACCAPYLDQFFRLLNAGQGRQKDCLDPGEDRRVGPDAQS